MITKFTLRDEAQILFMQIKFKEGNHIIRRHLENKYKNAENIEQKNLKAVNKNRGNKTLTVPSHGPAFQ